MFTNEQSAQLMRKYNIDDAELKDYLENKSIEDCKPFYPSVDNLEMVIKSYLTFGGNYTDTDSNNTLEPQVNDNNIDTENANTTSMDTNKNDVKYPVAVGRDIRLNKKWPYNYQLHMMIESKKNIGSVDGMEFTNYLYDNDLKKVDEFVHECDKAKNKKPTSKRTRDKYIDFMVSSGYDYVSQENTSHGVVYKLSAKGKEGCYTTIYRSIIKTLLLCTNKNMAKLYAFMKYYIEQDGRTFVPMDRAFLARNIGLSTNTHKGVDTISEMVTTLAQIGLIEIERQTKKELDLDGNKTFKTVNFYRICTYEEWKASRKRAQGRSK